VIYPIMHEACDQVAFYYTEQPVWGEPIDPKLAVLIDGTTPINGEPMICGSCGQECSPADVNPAGGYA
jgi:hypothetical protein